MGYRSNIKMAIQGKHEDIVVLLTNWRLAQLPGYKEAHETLMLTRDDDMSTISLDASSWKWYDDFSDIQALEKLWSMAEELAGLGRDIDGAFIRIGEDDSDTDPRVFGDGCDLISYQRSSTFEFNTNESKPLDESFSHVA